MTSQRGADVTTSAKYFKELIRYFDLVIMFLLTCTILEKLMENFADIENPLSSNSIGKYRKFGRILEL